MENCSLSSGFQASNLVTGFHNIPHVDIDLNRIPADFQITLDYFEAIIIWACIPILVVVCLFVLMSVYFICVCCCCCFQQHEKRSKCSKATCGVLVTLLVFLCLGMVGVGLWSEFEWDKNLNQFVTTVNDVNDLVGNIQTQASSYDEAAIGGNLTVLDNAINDPNVNIRLQALMSVNSNLDNVFNDISTRASLSDLSPVVNVARSIELARHWAVVAYLIVLALVLILLASSLCCSACCSNPACTVLTLFLFSFITFTAWVAVGGNLAYLVVSGDLCYDPDNLIRNYTSNAANATVSTDVVNYYVVCNETCVSSPFQESYDNATQAFGEIPNAESVVRDYINNNNRPDLLPNINAINTSFSSAESAIDNLIMLSNCTRLNGDYLLALNSFCTNGHMFSLILFAMICGLSLGMMISIICATFYAGLLSSGKEYDEETVVYDFPDGQSSPWDSYGVRQTFTGGQYNQFREEYHLRSSPPMDESGPPKYTDLSARTTSMDNGGDATVERRPGSGAYDHFADS